MEKSKKNLRVFGFIWAFIFFLISYFNHFNLVTLTLFCCFFFSASFFPNIYVKTYIFQLWMKIGWLLGYVNSKIIVFILFFFIFTPIGFLLKIFGKDLLKKRLDKNSMSYFEKRKIQPGSMRNQF